MSVPEDTRRCICKPDLFAGDGCLEINAACPQHGFYDAAGKWIHPRELSREALLDLVSGMSWMALDLAQHLNFTNEALKPEFKEEAYHAAERMAYAITDFPYRGPEATDGLRQTPGVAIFDGKGGFS